jgi:hypothetical protein
MLPQAPRWPAAPVIVLSFAARRFSAARCSGRRWQQLGRERVDGAFPYASEAELIRRIEQVSQIRRIESGDNERGRGRGVVVDPKRDFTLRTPSPLRPEDRL